MTRPLVTVTEYAKLTTASGYNSLSEATISETAFDWLCETSEKFTKSGAPLVQLSGRQWLTLDSYVGVVETPCGTQIEILPKHVDGTEDIDTLRRLMVRMLSVALDIRPRTWGETNLQVFDSPVSEWLMSAFLERVDSLVKKGIRSDYSRVEEESRFLRGRLDVARQLRQVPGRDHLLHVAHDVFTADRPENRLIRSALQVVRRRTRLAKNWQLSQELACHLEEIPLSVDTERDFRAWRDDRLMVHYRDIKPLCEFILSDQMPFSQVGDWHGMSMLFPMERLFERYVAAKLSHRIAPDWTFSYQVQSKYLCSHRERQWFQLRPDMAVRSGHRLMILDAKWKRLDESASDSKTKYGLKQSDFYQLFAYGQQYLQGRGDLFLIYPKTATFSQPMAPFHFSEALRLWVVPFDLDAGRLVSGDWLAAAPWLSQDLPRVA